MTPGLADSKAKAVAMVSLLSARPGAEHVPCTDSPDPCSAPTRQGRCQWTRFTEGEAEAQQGSSLPRAILLGSCGTRA